VDGEAGGTVAMVCDALQCAVLHINGKRRDA
jgi:hypothetical protein